MMFLITGKQFLDFGVWFGQYMMPINGDDQRKGNYVFFLEQETMGLLGHLLLFLVLLHLLLLVMRTRNKT